MRNKISLNDYLYWLSVKYDVEVDELFTGLAARGKITKFPAATSLFNVAKKQGSRRLSHNER